MRQIRRSADRIKIVMPAHLCQLKYLRRAGEKGRPVMYRPKPKMPIKASARTQCKAMAVLV